MKFKVLTQQGKSYTDDIDYVVVTNDEGERAILDNHIAIIVQVSDGHLKFVKDKEESFLVVDQAIVEFKNNVLTVLAIEAQMAKTLEKARTVFAKAMKEKMEASKKENIDFSKYERELKENIAKSRAGHI